MYLIHYVLLTEDAQHYAPSTTAAIALIEEIERGAGKLVGVTRTSDNKSLTLEDLRRIAAPDVGPADNRSTQSLTGRFRRLLSSNFAWVRNLRQ